MKEKLWKFFNFTTADPILSLAVARSGRTWLLLVFRYSDDLILIVLIFWFTVSQILFLPYLDNEQFCCYNHTEMDTCSSLAWMSTSGPIAEPGVDTEPSLVDAWSCDTIQASHWLMLGHMTQCRLFISWCLLHAGSSFVIGQNVPWKSPLVDFYSQIQVKMNYFTFFHHFHCIWIVVFCFTLFHFINLSTKKYKVDFYEMRIYHTYEKQKTCFYA